MSRRFANLLLILGFLPGAWGARYALAQVVEPIVTVPGPRIASGWYTGDGTGERAVSGLGFAPDLVLVKGLSGGWTTTRIAVVATGDFPDGTAKALTENEDPFPGMITELTDDGFLLGPDIRVNADREHYEWLALQADGITSAVGRYNGNGNDDRLIDVGFRPDYVLVIPLNDKNPVQRFRDEAYDRCLSFRDEGDLGNRIQDFAATGFVVGSDAQTNANAVAYVYLALRESPGVQVGSYVGDGETDRVIAGLHNLPALLLAKRRDARRAVHTWQNVAEWSIGYTFDDTGPLLNDTFLGLDSSSFTIGDSDRINASGRDHYWLALGPSTDVALSLYADQAVAQAGDTLRFTVVAPVRGPDRADSLAVAVQLPPGLTYAWHQTADGRFDPETGIWTTDPVEPQDSGHLVIVAVVDEGTAGQELPGTASLQWCVPEDDDGSNDAAKVSVQVVLADLAVTVTTDTPEAAPGDTVTCTVRADNAGSVALSGVMVRDRLPAGLDYAGHVAAQGTYDPLSGDWSVGDLAPGGGSLLSLRAVVDTAGVTVWDRASLVATVPADGNAANDADSVAIAVPAADVAVAVAASDTLPHPGDGVTLTVTAVNHGPDPASDVIVRNVLPTGLTLVSGTPDQGSWEPATGRWTVGDLGAGGTATLVLETVVDGGTGGLALVDSVRRVASTPVDLEPANDAAAVALHVQSSDLLALTVAVDDTFPLTGAPVNVTVTLRNVAAGDAHGIVVRDVLPPALELQSAVPSVGTYDPVTGTWDVGSLGGGSSCVLLLGTEVRPGHAGTTVADTAMVVAVDEPDDVPDNDTAVAALTIQGADLRLAKSVDNPAPNVGETVTFTVALENRGPHAATGVTVRDTLPVGLVYVGHAVDAGSYDPLTGFWSVGDLASETGATLQLQAQVNLDIGQGAEAINTAGVTAVDQEDPAPGQESDSAALTLQSADLALAQTVDPAAADEGEDVVLGLVLTNAGPASATGVVVRQDLPPGLRFVAASAPVDTTGGAVTWSVGDMIVDGRDSLAVTVRPAEGTAGTRLPVTVAVTELDQADPDGGNDSDADTVRVRACDLAVSATARNPAPTVGDTVTFAVGLANDGPDAAPDAVVAVDLDAGLALVSATATTGTFDGTAWHPGELPAGAVDSLWVAATIQPGTIDLSLALTATADPGGRPDVVSDNDTADASVVVQGSDLSLDLATSVETPNPGETVLLTVNVASAGPQDARDVVVRHRLPPALLYQQHTPAGAAYDPATGLWTVGDVPAGQARALVITARVAEGTAGTTVVDSAAVVAAWPADPDGSPPATTLSLRIPAVDLAVGMIPHGTTADVGDTITVAITAANAGPDDASGVVIREDLPGGLVLLAADRPDYDPVTGRWVLGDLAAAAAETLHLDLRVAGGTAGDTLVATASLASVDQQDLSVADDADTLHVAVSPQADVAVTVRADVARPNRGDPVAWSVTVANLGPSAVAGVMVRDSLAAGLIPDPERTTWSQGTFDPDGGTWTVGALPPGGEATLLLGSRVADDVFGLTLGATAWIAGADVADPDPANDTATDSVTVQSADLAMAAFLDVASPGEGETVNFTVYVTDAGPDPADSVTVRLELPSGLLYRGHTPPDETVVPDPGGEGYLWQAGTVPLGSPRVLFVRTEVAAGTTGSEQVARAVLAGAAQGDPDTTDNAAADTLLVGGVDLALAADAVPATAAEGDTVVFHLALTNHGSNDGTGIVVRDSLDAGLTWLWAEPSEGYDALARRWDVGALAADSTTTLALAVRVAERTGGRTLAGRFVVERLDQVDPDADNDTAVAGVAVAVPDTGHVLAWVDPAGAGRVIPGDTPLPLLAWRLVNWSVVPDTLTGLTVRAAAPGGGGTVAPDADWQPLTLAWRRAGSGEPWLPLGTVAMSDGTAVFPLTLALAPAETLALRVTGGAAPAAADGDTLVLSLHGPSAATFTRPVRVDAAWPLRTTDPPAVDGMSTAQVTLHPVATRILAPGSSDELVLDLTLPSDGARTDTLRGLLLWNVGTARPGEDVAGVAAWLDDGDGVLDVTADSLLGRFADTGDRWALSGLALPLPPGGRRVFVTADVAPGATGGRTLRFGLPGPPEVAISVAGENDGLVDGALANPHAQVVNQPGLVYLAGAAPPDRVVRPGERDVLLWRLTGTNTDSLAHTLTALTLRRTGGVPVAHDPDGTVARLTVWADDGDGALAAGDTLLGETSLTDGTAAWSGLHWRLPPLAERDLLVAVDVSLTGAADGDTLGLRLAGPEGIVFVGATLFQVETPLDGARAVVDGMVAVQVGVITLPARTVAPGDSLLPLFSFRVPDDGGAGDLLREVALELLPGAEASDVARLRLWRDGGDGLADAGAGDDVALGDLLPAGVAWHRDGLDLTVPPGGVLLHVTADVAPTATPGHRLRAALPVLGLTLASGNSGPLDGPVAGTAVLTVSTAPLAAEPAWDVAMAAPGDTVALSLRVVNRSDEAVTAVTPALTDLLPDGLAAVTEGPVPANADLAPADSALFTWRLAVAAPGTLRVITVATGDGPDGPVASDPVPAAPLPVVSDTSGVTATVSPLLPALVADGRSDVPALLWVVRAGGDDPAAPSPELVSVALRLEEPDGTPLPPSAVAGRVVLRSGGAEIGRAETDTVSGTRVVVPLTTPLALAGDHDTVVQAFLDLVSGTTVDSFRVAFPAASWLRARSSLTGAAVPVACPGQELPLQTAPARIVAPVSGLVVAAAGDTVAVSQGQTGVPAVALTLSLADTAAGQSALVDTLRLVVRDAGDRSLPVVDLCRRVRVATPGRPPVEAEPEAGSPVLSVPLGSPLTVATGPGVPLSLIVDLADEVAPGTYRLGVPDDGIAARDPLTGTAVAVTLDGTAPLGGALAVQRPAAGVVAGALPEAAERAAVGGRDVPLLVLAFTHPGLPGTAALAVDTIRLRGLDGDGGALDLTRLLEGVSIRRDGVPVDPAPVVTPVAGDLVIALQGQRVTAGGQLVLTVCGDVAPAAVPGVVTVAAPLAGLAVTDANTGLPAAVTPAPGQTSPLASGPLTLVRPADRLTVAAADSMPAMLAAGSADPLPVLRLSVTNTSGEGSGDLWFGGLMLDVRDGDGRPLRAADVVASASLAPVEGGWEAVVAGKADGDSLLDLRGDVPLVLETGRRRDLVLTIVPVAEPAATRITIGFAADGMAVVPADSAGIHVTVVPEPGTVLPFRTAPATFTRLDLAGSYANFPNPFAAGREVTTFVYALSRPGRVDLTLYTPRGEVVRRLLTDAEREAGVHQDDTWDGRNGHGHVVRNGVYLAEIRVRYADGTGERLVRKVAVVR